MEDKMQEWKDTELKQAAKEIAEVQLKGEIERFRIDCLKQIEIAKLEAEAKVKQAQETTRSAERQAILDILSEAAQHGDLEKMIDLQALLSQL